LNNPLIYVDPSGELSVRQILLLAKSFAESFVKKAAQKIVEAIGGLSLKNLGFFKDIVVGIIKGVIRLSDIASVLAEGYFKEYIEPVERLINLSSEVFGRGVVCDSKVIEYGKYLGIAVCNIVEIISDFATGGTGVFGKVAGKLVSVLGKAGKRVRTYLGRFAKLQKLELKISEKTLKWLNEGVAEYKVYFGIDKKTGKAVYVGITKRDPNIRLNEHNRSGKDFERLDVQLEGLTRNQARAIEQYFIEHGPNQLNKANSISPRSEYYSEALKWAEYYLKKNKLIE